MAAGWSLVNLKEEMVKSWRSANQERAPRARAKVKFHNPAADILLGAILEREQKIGDIACDLADDATTPGELALLLIEMSLSTYAACCFHDDYHN
jgi:hypothetical protein